MPKYKEHRCLGCGNIHDVMTAITEDDKSIKPTNGDIIVCFNCGSLSSVDDSGDIRELTKEELIDVAGDKQLISIVNLIGEKNEAKRRKKSTSSFEHKQYTGKTLH